MGIKDKLFLLQRIECSILPIVYRDFISNDFIGLFQTKCFLKISERFILRNKSRCCFIALYIEAVFIEKVFSSFFDIARYNSDINSRLRRHLIVEFYKYEKPRSTEKSQ